jgi:predicted phosphodiesterase
MPILVLSDVHANLEALAAVLDAAPPFDAVWCLGDAVGYGPDPNAVVERLTELEPAVWLAGNHDHAALGKLDLSAFNADARRAVEWTAEHMSVGARARLLDLAPRHVLPEQDVTLVHGSPRHPIWEYILSARTAMECFDDFTTALCLFGHTHVPVIYQAEVDGALRANPVTGTRLEPGDRRWLANPGSVGQPRDGDPRASFLLYDPATRGVTFQRVTYDIGATQAKMLAAGLPSRLAARLDLGW